MEKQQNKEIVKDTDLVSCPACLKNISVISASCPKCGYVFKEGEARERKISEKKTQNGCMIFFVLFVFVVPFIWGVFSDDSDNKKTIPPRSVVLPVCKNLPPHRVTENLSLFPSNDGYRISIESNNPDLTKSECIEIIDCYRSSMGEGLIGVSKPSKANENSMLPWCVLNKDDADIRFNDYFFE